MSNRTELNKNHFRKGNHYSNLVDANLPNSTEGKTKVENLYHRHAHDYQERLPMSIQINRSSLDRSHQLCEELLPPPSPVSSSYSELRRAVDNHNYPAMKVYPPASYHRHPTYANMYQNDYIYSTYPANSGQTVSPYESIYEPINSYPQNQIPCASNILNYPSNINGHPYQPGLNQNNTMLDQRKTDVDALTELWLQSMKVDNDNYGTCFQCGKKVIGEASGCTAMGKIYHIACFTCSQCQINLQGKPFYAVDGKPCCEEDYLNTLEKCSVCMEIILQRILRANGKSYHPKCFCCVVCGKSLDSVPFTVDALNQNHCIEDFHKKFAPRCCVCHQPIMPEQGKDETIRVVALDRSFHVSCYKCEDCGLKLSTEAEGKGCYPLDDHILCKNCNARRVQTLTSGMNIQP